MENGSTVAVTSELPPGLIAGRYVIGESFASGGMGTVHLGRIVGAGGFSRVVAIKRLFPSAANDRAFREMLLEEARLVSRIRHPNVVPALDVVEDREDVYIVMEYVHGPSLAQLLTRARGRPRSARRRITEAAFLPHSRRSFSAVSSSSRPNDFRRPRRWPSRSGKRTRWRRPSRLRDGSSASRPT